MAENRLFPRIEWRSQQQAILLNEKSRLLKNLVLSQDISAAGIRFRSAHSFEGNPLFLIRFENNVAELRGNQARVLKSGDFYLAKAVWHHESTTKDDPFFEVGCCFVPQNQGSLEIVDQFTKLINRVVLEQIG